MRLLVLGLALLLAGCAASPDRPTCDRALVSAAMKSLAPVSRPQVVEDINRRKTVRVVSIQEDGLGIHQYKYSAVLDLDANAVGSLGTEASSIRSIGSGLLPCRRHV